MSHLLAINVPVWELVARGSVIYLGLVAVVRFILRRDVGALGMPDLLFIVLVADAAQNAMAGEYTTLSEGAILLGTLVFWNVALDHLAYRWPSVRRLVEPAPLPLVVDGRILRRNLRKEWITVDELQAKLREHGVDDLRAVRRATLEPDGELSVLKCRESPGEDEPHRQRLPGA